MQLAADLRVNAMKWESVNEGVAARLMQLAIEDDDCRERTAQGPAYQRRDAKIVPPLQ